MTERQWQVKPVKDAYLSRYLAHRAIIHPAPPDRITQLNPPTAQRHWPDIFTDWCVIRALGTTNWPAILNSDMTQAAFASEVSAYLRFHALALREAEVETRMTLAAEAAFEQVGGSFYQHTRDAFETAQTDFLLGIAHAARSPRDTSVRHSNPASPQLAQCRLELDRLRRRAAPSARLARRRVAENYWAQVAGCRLPEDFFASAQPGSVLARLPQRLPIWWGRFVQALHDVLQRTNPSYCRIMEQLPQLRKDAARPRQRFVLSALVENWRQENAERIGLFEEIHFPMLERRSLQKLAAVAAWFDARVPDFKNDPSIRERARWQLYERLGCVAPDDLHHGRN